MKTRFYHWYNYLLSTLLYILGYGMMGCTEQGDEYGPEPVMYESTPEPVVDTSFIPEISYLYGLWAAEYEGWDNVQETNVTIRRGLTLNPDSTYTNLVGGKMEKFNDKGFMKLESEGGKYIYNQSAGIITYYVEYDSVLNFPDQNFTVYSKKHYYDREESSYTEKVGFSREVDGKRKWITVDDHFTSSTNIGLEFLYAMDKYEGER